MASSSPHSHWEAPTFHFNSPNQSEDWSTLYTRALDYLDALDIEAEVADESCKGWKQLKLMFEGDDRKAHQSLIDSGVGTAEHMLKPKAALDAIGTTIESEEHFWGLQGWAYVRLATVTWWRDPCDIPARMWPHHKF